MTVPVFVSTVRSPSRSTGLDAVRGLAILAMLVDHLMVVTAGPDLVRNTVGRLAAPAFFLVSGHLVRRLSWRHYGVLLLGLLLPVVVPWIDRPNVLVVYVLGAALIVACRRLGVAVWLLAVVALACSANGYRFAGPQSFDVLALVGIMALGAWLPRSSFSPAGSLPAWLAVVGRRPLTWYVGHLLVLQAVVILLGGSP